MEEITVILTEEDKEMVLERYDEMKAMKNGMEAQWKQMQEMMNALELKMEDKMDHLTKDVDGMKSNLQVQTERQTNCELQLKEDEKKIQLERRLEMRAMKFGIEEYLKEIMQRKMNELELKVDNKMDQLTKDLDGIKANLHEQTEILTTCEMPLKGVSAMKMLLKLDEMRGEIEKIRSEQTREFLKSNEVLETIYTTKGRADAFIQLLEQKDEKMIKELNEHKTNMNTMMDAYKNQLEDMKTTFASMDKDSGKEPRALVHMETKILDTMKDLQRQFQWLCAMKKLRKDERPGEMDHTKLDSNELAQKVEKMEAQINKDGDELRLNVDNQITSINKQLETIENRVTENENKLAAFDNNVTIMGIEEATNDNSETSDDNSVISDDSEIEAINNSLATVENKVDAHDNRITVIDQKVLAIDNQISDAGEEVKAINNRLTWMENWQKKHLNIGQFGTLRQIDGCQVSEFTFMVKNIGEEILKAKHFINSHHCIESEPFYTDYMGYRAKVVVHPNNNNTKHLGVYLSLVEGEFDAIVSWPFQCKYEFHSVSQDGTEIAYHSIKPSTLKASQEPFSRPPSNNSKGFGIPKYISSEKLLAKSDLLVDGGLSIKVTIWLTE